MLSNDDAVVFYCNHVFYFYVYIMLIYYAFIIMMLSLLYTDAMIMLCFLNK